MNLRRAALYFHTLRHLKPGQVWGRLSFRIFRPTPDLRPAPPLRKPGGSWSVPAARQASMLSPTRFRFLNREKTLATAQDWNSSEPEQKLWTYNLHYFDDLNAVAASRRCAWHQALIQRWIAENPPATGTGWDPYPLSLRIVNWIKWSLAGNALDEQVRHSLAVQTRFLAGRLEHHLLGNHLFVNAKALVFAGCYFDGDEAAEWIHRGMRILAREIPEQILADGGHFERSTMYHALAYEDMLDLANVAAAFPLALLARKAVTEAWPALIDRMGHWLAAMCHPDGEISLFNDASPGIAPPPADLFAYAQRLGHQLPTANECIIWLKESGYIRVQQNRAVLLIDAAPLGPDYLPAHGHADTLSFELSLDRQRLIVNSGTSRYGLGPERDWERSTAAHSTVEVDQQDSSEVWAGFRVARRARPFDIAVRESDTEVVVEGAHDGYRRLGGRVDHRRQWRLGANGLSIHDEILGTHSSAIARYYLHPGIAVEASESSGKFCWKDEVVTWHTENGQASAADSLYASAFGARLANRCLELRATKGQGTLVLNWR